MVMDGQTMNLVKKTVAEKNTNVLDYYRDNSNLEIVDLFKFLYQSCFGCEHLVSNYDDALCKIMLEAEHSEQDDLPNIELLDGNYCRLHLKLFTNKDSKEKLCLAFINSAQIQPDGKERLEEQLQKLLGYASEGLIEFDCATLKQDIETWKNQGYPAVHHSETFRKTHHPAYRVIMKKYLRELLH